MKIINLAVRNVFRNKRRSVMTLCAIAIGTSSILLFGGYVVGMILNIQSDIVRGSGHLHVYKTNYFAEGAADPAAYALEGSEELLRAIREDEYLSQHVVVATPMQYFGGIVGNFSENSSQIFFGKGIIPADRDKMREWNVYNIAMPEGSDEEPALDQDDLELGVIGRGMAKNLSLCNELASSGCTDAARPVKKEAPPEEVADLPPLDLDLGFLEDLPAEDTPAPEVEAGTARLDLMAAMAGGAPNVVQLKVRETADFGERTLDQQYLLVHLELAQQLLYGRSTPKVTGVQLQLQKTTQIPVAQQHLETIIAEHGWDMEVKNFYTVAPLYIQILSLFQTIFGFMTVLMLSIVLFTIANTMRMAVMERLGEIGTLRSMGLRQNGIMKLFVWEGSLLGVLGASIGVLLAVLVGAGFNASGLTWVPPMRVTPVFLVIKLFQVPQLVPATWLGIVLASLASSVVPAKFAARIPVVDALREV
jgi:putative ABC transport system permease protein